MLGTSSKRMPASSTEEDVTFGLLRRLSKDRRPLMVSVPLLNGGLLVPLRPLVLELRPNWASRRSTMVSGGSTKVASELLAPHRATASANGCPSTRCQTAALLRRSASWPARRKANSAAAAQLGAGGGLRVCSIAVSLEERTRREPGASVGYETDDTAAR